MQHIGNHHTSNCHCNQYSPVSGAKRLAIFQEACGIFEGREEEMLKELADIRRGFKRKMPPIATIDDHR
jgi:hypothetical protein